MCILSDDFFSVKLSKGPSLSILSIGFYKLPICGTTVGPSSPHVLFCFSLPSVCSIFWTVNIGGNS